MTINREKLIEVLIKYKINPYIINMIFQMYEGDKTTIHLGKLKRTIKVTSGIRKGCSISTLLFKMVTFTILEQLNKDADPYEIGVYKENSLLLADDAAIIAKEENSLNKVLKTLDDAGIENWIRVK